MPKRRTRAPIYEGAGGTDVYRAKILSVDKVKWTCTVQSELDNKVYDGVPIEPTCINSDGGGQFFLPETNSVVWCCRPNKEVTPFIMGAATLPAQLDEGDDEEDPNDRRFNRPVVNEGDNVLVKVVKIDERDRIRLSLKAITEEEKAKMEQTVGSDG